MAVEKEELATATERKFQLIRDCGGGGSAQAQDEVFDDDAVTTMKVGAKVFLAVNSRVGSIVPASPGIIFLDEAKFHKPSIPPDEKSICFRRTYIEAS